MYRALQNFLHGIIFAIAITNVAVSENAYIVSDINKNARNIAPFGLTSLTLAKTIYFLRENSTGGELWKSGDDLRAVLVYAASAGSQLSALTTLSNKIYFVECRKNSDCKLFVSDGSASGTREIVQLNGTSGIDTVSNLGSELLLVAKGGARLWLSNGTTAGTSSINSPNGYTVTATFPAINRTYLQLRSTTYNNFYYPESLGVIQRTIGGVIQVDSIGTTIRNPANFTRSGDLIVFSGYLPDDRNNRHLFSSDGSIAGTIDLGIQNVAFMATDTSGALSKVRYKKNSSYETVYTLESSAGEVTLGTQYYDFANSKWAGFSPPEIELAAVPPYLKDGHLVARTSDPEKKLHEILHLTPQGIKSIPSLFYYGDTPPIVKIYDYSILILRSIDATHTNLCSYYPTRDDLNNVTCGNIIDGVPVEMSVTGTQVYMTLLDTTKKSTDIWTSNGRDLFAAPLSVPTTTQRTWGSNPILFGSVGNYQIFSANDGIHGDQIWSSNIVTGDTRLIKEVSTNSRGIIISPVGTSAGYVYFFVTDKTLSTTYALWRSDGTPIGTQKVASGAGQNVLGGGFAGKKIVYQVNNLSGEYEIWASDEGTLSKLASLGTSAAIIEDGRGGTLENTIYFRVVGSGLWRSDGKTASLATELPAYNSSINALRVLQGKLYYYACGMQYTSCTLYTSGGTSASTKSVKTYITGSAVGLSGTIPFVPSIIFPSQIEDSPYFLIQSGTYYYFYPNYQQNHLESSFEIVKVDPSGESLVASLPLAGLVTTSFADKNGIYFPYSDAANGEELWFGSANNKLPSLYKDLVQGTSSSSPQEVIMSGGDLYVTGKALDNINKLFKITLADGSVSEVALPAGSMSILNLMSVAGKLFFSLSTFDLGAELGSISSCKNDSKKNVPGYCGCGIPDVDQDSDGVLDCMDSCSSDSNKIEPLICGCGIADVDSDMDGTLNCRDLCPQDSRKTVAGICGCGAPDTDSDNDSVPDCKDSCPKDPKKLSAGQCGCGIADIDSDQDSVADCKDSCPLDPRKTTPGLCGCGRPDSDANDKNLSSCNGDPFVNVTLYSPTFTQKKRKIVVKIDVPKGMTVQLFVFPAKARASTKPTKVSSHGKITLSNLTPGTWRMKYRFTYKVGEKRFVSNFSAVKKFKVT